MVQPSNLADVVQEFITHLALEPEKKFFLEQNDPGETSLFPGGVDCHYNLHRTLLSHSSLHHCANRDGYP